MLRRAIVAAAAVVLMVLAATTALASPARAQDEGVYQFHNRNSEKPLAADATKTKLIQGAFKDNAQQWKLVKVGDYFKIVHVKTGKAVTAPANAMKEGAGTQATLEKDSGGPEQQWKFQERKGKNESYWVIKSRTEEMVLDVENASSDAGARVILWPFNSRGQRTNQEWILVPGK